MASRKRKVSSQFTLINRVSLIHSGKQYFDALLQMIRNARDSIHIQTYIYDEDETGREVAAALQEAVARNVSVYLLVDGYASQRLSPVFIDELRKAGIHFRFFEPVFRSSYFYFGRRLHHKIAVADTRFALIGGINISNRYNDVDGKTAWLDFALFAEGEIALQACVLCWKTWNGYPPQMGLTPCEINPATFDIPVDSRSEVRLRRNDWVRRKNEISSTYIDMLRGAKHDVVILSSYFLPGQIIRRQIKQAIRRGVRIRVIAAGPSDVMVSKHAERWFYDWLLRNGIELYEFSRNILHGKIAVCDDQWMTVGSYNINNISAYASIELNFDVRDPAFTASVRQQLEMIIANDCERITEEQHKKAKNIFLQFIRWCSYQFIRATIYLFTFYFRHKD